jgi:ASC-1-like (ASCH) protein
MTAEHNLKTWPEYFRSVWDGSKTFEVRKSDRNFKVGDSMILQEWDPSLKEYTGRSVHTTITYILNGGNFGIEQGTCVIAFQTTMIP